MCWNLIKFTTSSEYIIALHTPIKSECLQVLQDDLLYHDPYRLDHNIIMGPCDVKYLLILFLCIGRIGSDLNLKCGSYMQSVGLLVWVIGRSEGGHVHRTTQIREKRRHSCL
jgi:hypothetical protein